MSPEVFRFVSVRPVQQPVGPTPPQPLILRLDQGDSEFLTTLQELADYGSRGRLHEFVRSFVRSRPFIGSPGEIDGRLIDFNAKLVVLPDKDFAKTAAVICERTFDSDARRFAQSDAFRNMRRAIGESIVAAAIDASVSARVRALLAGLAAACALIEALAAGRSFGKGDFLAAVLILPEPLFPLARRDGGLAAHRAGQRTARERRRAEQLALLQQRAREIEDGRKAIAELLDVVVRRPPGPASSVDPTPRPIPRAQADSVAGTAGFVLSPAERDGLSAGTKAVLESVGMEDRVDPARAVVLIEDRLATVAAALHRPARDLRLVRIGASVIAGELIPDAALGADAGGTLRHPGPCPPDVLADPGEETGGVTVPTGHGEARILGIADLMIVEQELARYELSEIAHIENVLRTERRERKFRTATTTEETILVETETTEEREKDLASTERFELQTESQRVINESASKEAGITIHASYGPTVDATAKLGFSSTTATQNSDRTSSSYARETTSRAVNRLQTRTMERREIRTVREVEEKNLHGFDNSAGATDISGIYRFVDKIYTAQVVNYGKRLMLEFLVPEPAAFWRYALTRQPLAPVSYVNPEPPGYCLEDGRTFVPLQVQDITPENYVFWAGKYGAEDVGPPPPRTRVVSSAKKSPEQFQTTNAADAPKIGSDAYEIDIPDGYVPASAIVNLYGETQAGTHKLVVQVQDQQFFYVEPVDDGVRLDLRLEPTAKLPISINALRFHNYEMLVTVFCVLRREALEQWQLEAFFAITKAYEAAKARYDNAVEAARIQAGFDPTFGRHPAANREIERTELKRACVSLATGQRFESFDAMARNVGPYGYPEIDFAEAKAEARWVELFEQAFEWNNMTYLFYPYFWGRKDEWVTLVQLVDDDLLFQRFLQAGAARVQVPVRPGFESVILNYLSGIAIWDADGNFVDSELGEPNPLHLAIVAELKSQLGNNDVAGPGTVALTKGSDLVTGAGTEFTREDENRRIAFGTARYVIKTWEAPDRIRLRSPYTGPNDEAAGYSLGPRLVGEPWEVRLPTNLVKIDDYAIA